MADKIARAVQPNAGVEAWYRSQLQTLVGEMASAGLAVVREAWHESRPGVALAADSVTTYAAGVLFRLPDGRILLCHRVDGHVWAFPAGGVDPSEAIEGAARREAQEESGWGGQQDLEFLEIRQTRGLRFATYLCDVPAPFPVTLNNEHSEYRWVTPEYAMACLRLHPGVLSTLVAHFGSVSVAADAKPTATELLRRALNKWGEIWRGKLDDLSLDLAAKFAKKNFKASQTSIAASFKDAGLTVKFKPTAASVEAYDAVVAENVNLIKSIPQQFAKDVESQVWRSVMKGGDLSTLSKNIQKSYGVSYRRAALIARDQNNKAKAVIENTRRRELGITEAIWQHSNAGKEPRPTHVAMNGKRFKLAKGMYDSAVKKFILPGEEIQCRCTSRAVILGFN